MSASPIGYYNGVTAPLDELTVPALDRAVYFGDGVYDAAFVNRGEPFRLGDHTARFLQSCSMIGINPPGGEDELTVLLKTLCRDAGFEYAMLYFQASRGTAPRAHVFDSGMKPNLFAYVKPLARPDMTRKIKLITEPDIRYLLCNVKTLNLIPNILAATRAESLGCDEAVFIRDGIVTECSHSNISALRGGCLITHPLDEKILPGTVRGQLITLCGSLSVPVQERPLTPAELFQADEVVLTSSTAFIRSASHIDGKPVGGGDRELLALLQNKYAEGVFGVKA